MTAAGILEQDFLRTPPSSATHEHRSNLGLSEEVDRAIG